MAEGQERTEQATPRRREKARDKGQVAKSKELTSVASLGGIMLVLIFGGTTFVKNTGQLMEKLLRLEYGHDFFSAFRFAATETILLLIPFFIAAVSLAIAANVVQAGFLIKAPEVNITRISPLGGIKRIFSINGLVEFLKSLAKFAVLGYLCYFVIRRDIDILPSLMDMDIIDIAKMAGDLILEAILYGFFFFFIIAVISYFLEKWRFEKSIRMSKEEIKEERKETDGDPHVKSRIRSIQREMARKRMMEEVPKATVVITNPTHLAIALKYNDKEMSAPKVTAKGSGHVALKIREIAEANRVPIVEDKPLARMLFKLELNSNIPQDLYKAVAKILAYIYKLKGAA